VRRGTAVGRYARRWVCRRSGIRNELQAGPGRVASNRSPRCNERGDPVPGLGPRAATRGPVPDGCGTCSDQHRLAAALTVSRPATVGPRLGRLARRLGLVPLERRTGEAGLSGWRWPASVSTHDRWAGSNETLPGGWVSSTRAARGGVCRRFRISGTNCRPAGISRDSSHVSAVAAVAPAGPASSTQRGMTVRKSPTIAPPRTATPLAMACAARLFTAAAAPARTMDGRWRPPVPDTLTDLRGEAPAGRREGSVGQALLARGHPCLVFERDANRSRRAA
jgi:hypothetical protein